MWRGIIGYGGGRKWGECGLRWRWRWFGQDGGRKLAIDRIGDGVGCWFGLGGGPAGVVVWWGVQHCLWFGQGGGRDLVGFLAVVYLLLLYRFRF